MKKERKKEREEDLFEGENQICSFSANDNSRITAITAFPHIYTADSLFFWFSADCKCGKPVFWGFPPLLTAENLFFKVFQAFSFFFLFSHSFYLGQVTGRVHGKTNTINN